MLTDRWRLVADHDGFLIIRGAVSKELTSTARTAIKAAAAGELDGYIGEADAMTDLVNASQVAPILRECMGEFDPPASSQFGLTRISRDVDSNLTATGYRSCDSPYLGAGPGLHIDGSCTIGVPGDKVFDGTEQEIYDEYINSGPAGALGRSADVIGHNSVPLFEDTENTLGLGSFSAFVICALNDQSEHGRGQTTILPGAHLVAEKFFQWQRDHPENTQGRMGIEVRNAPLPLLFPLNLMKNDVSCQDRLGTNAKKTQKERAFHPGSWVAATLPQLPQPLRIELHAR